MVKELAHESVQEEMHAHIFLPRLQKEFYLCAGTCSVQIHSHQIIQGSHSTSTDVFRPKFTLSIPRSLNVCSQKNKILVDISQFLMLFCAYNRFVPLKCFNSLKLNLKS